MNKKRTGVLTVLCLLMLAQGASSYYGQEITADNRIRSGAGRVEMVEKFRPDHEWLPGETMEKAVFVRNPGEEALSVRIRISERTDPEEADASITAAVVKNWTDAWYSDWEQRGDHYYYKRKLLPGESTEVFLESVYLDPEALKDYIPDGRTRQYHLEFEVEAIRGEWSPK